MTAEWWESMYLTDELTGELTEPDDLPPKKPVHRWTMSVPNSVAAQVDWACLEPDGLMEQNLRPLAESLSLLEFASNGRHIDWRDWLSVAWCITLSTHTEKWQELSWIRNIVHENTVVEEAYNSWQTLKRISK
jgi:hypothetical protein